MLKIREEQMKAFEVAAMQSFEDEMVEHGCAEARTYDFLEPRGDALLVILKFAFGYECTSDPLYPWISQTLNDKRIVNPAARAKRLEKKALTWLDHVLARPRQDPVNSPNSTVGDQAQNEG